MADEFDRLGDLDNQLDQEFDDFGFDEVDDDRDVVTGVGGNMKEIAKGAATPANLKNIGTHLLQAMPQSSALMNELRAISGITSSTTDEFKKEFAQVTDASRKLTKYALHKGKRYMPKKVYNRLDNFARGGREAKADTAAQDREDDLKTKLDDLFGVSGATAKAIEEGTAQQLVMEARRGSVDQRKLASLTQISNHLMFRNKFLATTQKNYMRKALELKYRHIYIAKDQLTQMKALNASMASHLAAIVKNTSLPDSLKYQGLEKTKKRIYGAVYEAGIQRLSDIGKNMAKQFREQITANLGDIASAMDMGVDTLEANDEMNAMFGGTKQARMGSAMGQGLSALIGKFLSRRLGGAMSQADMMSSGFLKSFTGGGRGAKLVMSNSNNKLLQGLAKFMGDPSVDVKMGNSMLDNGMQPAAFDVLTRQSIVEVIPAWLSKIAKNTRDLYEGYDTEEEAYDVTSRRIVKASKARSNLAKHIFGSVADRSGGYTQSVGAALQALDSSNLSIATDRAGLEKSISQVIANAIAIRLPLRPQYLKPFIHLTSDSQLKDENMKKLFRGVKNKVATLQALYFTLTTPDGKENFAMSNSINAGIYREISGESSFQDKLSRMMDSHGYGHIFRGQIGEDGTISQDWITSEIGNVGRGRYAKEVGAGRDTFIRDMMKDRRNKQSIESLKRSTLNLVNAPAEFAESFGSSRYSKFQQKGTQGLKMLQRVFEGGEDFNANEYIKTIANAPEQVASTLKDQYNLVQQMKIIELERQLIEERKTKQDEVPENEKLKFARRTNIIPDVDFFEGEFGAGRGFASRFGKYGAVHRPYLMDAYNKILMRKGIDDIYGFLKARFSKLPSWRRTQFKILEGIHKATIEMPVKMVTGLAKGLKNLLATPLSMMWEGFKDTFGLGKENKDAAKKKRAAIEKAKHQQDEIKRQLRTMEATEATARNTAAQIDILKHMMVNQVGQFRMTKLAATGTDDYVPVGRDSADIIQFDKTMRKYNQKNRRGSAADQEQQAEEDIRAESLERNSKSLFRLGRHLKMLNLATKVKTGLSIAAIGAVVVGVLKLIGNMKDRGIANVFGDYGMRMGLVSMFNEDGTVKTSGKQKVDAFKASAGVGEALGGDPEFMRKHRKLVDAGDAEGARKLADEFYRKQVASGAIDAERGRGNIKMHFKKKSLAKEMERSGIQFTKQQEQNLIALYQQGRDEEAESYMENLINQNKKAMFGAVIKDRATDRARSKQLTKRQKLLRTQFGFGKNVINDYMNLVRNNQPDQAAQYLAEARALQLEAYPDRHNDVTDMVITKVGKTLFTDGSLNWLDYGINQSQERFLRELASGRYNYEVNWYLEDILEANWAATGGKQQEGFDLDTSIAGKLRGLSILRHPKMFAESINLSGGLRAAGQTAGRIGGAIRGVAQRGFNAINNLTGGRLGTVVNKVGGVVKGAWNAAKNVGGRVVNKVKGVGSAIASKAKGAWNAVKGWGGKLWGKAKGVGTTIATKAKGLVNKLPSWMRTKPQWFSKVGQWFGKAGRFVKDLLPKAKKIIESIARFMTPTKLQRLGKGLSFLAKKLFSAAKGMLKFMAKYAGPIYFIMLIGGLLRGIFMKEESREAFNNKLMAGSIWSRALNTLLVAIDPWDTGIAVVQCIRAIAGAIKAGKQAHDTGKAAEEQHARLMEAAQQKMEEFRRGEEVPPEVMERVRKLLGETSDAIVEDEVKNDETTDPVVDKIDRVTTRISKDEDRVLKKDEAERERLKALLDNPNIPAAERMRLRMMINSGNTKEAMRQLRDKHGDKLSEKQMQMVEDQIAPSVVDKTRAAVADASRQLGDEARQAGANLKVMVAGWKTPNELLAQYGISHGQYADIIGNILKQAPQRFTEFICAVLHETQSKLVPIPAMIGGKIKGWDPKVDGMPAKLETFKQLFGKAVQTAQGKTPSPGELSNAAIQAAQNAGQGLTGPGTSAQNQMVAALADAQVKGNQQLEQLVALMTTMVTNSEFFKGIGGLAEGVARVAENTASPKGPTTEDLIPEIGSTKKKSFS